MVNRNSFRLLAVLLVHFAIASCAAPLATQAAVKVSTKNNPSLEEKAIEAWLYFYPMLLTQTRLAAEPELLRNSWDHSDDFYGKVFDQASKPEADTVHSHAWLDLRDGPINLHLPDMQGHYYAIQAIDLWSQTFSIVGSRTTGGKAGTVVYLPPGMHEELYPSGHWPIGARFVEAPSDTILLLAQLQRGGPDRAKQISGLHSKFLLRRHADSFLSGTIDADDTAAAVPEALAQYLAAGLSPANALLKIEPADYFSWAAALWGSREMSLSASDREFAAEIIQLGLYPGRAIQWQELTERRRKTLTVAANKASRILSAEIQKNGIIHNGWLYPVEEWYVLDGDKVSVSQPDNYLLRARMALRAPGHLPLEELLTLFAGEHETGGDVLNGGQDRQYELLFAPGDLPPVNGFWSLAVQETEGATAQNFLGRSYLGSDSQLTENPDGSVTIYLSHQNPHGEGNSDTFNWLPVPATDFGVELRVFWPSRKYGNEGGWEMPAIIQRIPAE